MLNQAGWRLLHSENIAHKQLVFAVFLGSLGGLMQVLQAWLLALVINGAFLAQRPLSALTVPLAALFVVVLVRAALSYFSSSQARFAALEIKHALRARLFDHIMALGPVWMKARSSAELTELCTTGVDALEVFLGEYLPRLAWAALIPLTILAVVFPLDSLTGVILLLTAPLIPLFMWLIGGLARRLAARQWRLLSRMSAHFLDILQGLPTLVRFNRSQRQTEAITAASERFRLTTMRVLQVAFLSALTLEMAATLSVAVIAVEVCVRLLGGGILFQQALFLLILAPEFYQPLRALSASYHASTSGLEALSGILKVLDEQPGAVVAAQPSAAPLSAPLTIRFESVAFRHADAAQDALQGISFTLEPGRHTALVGPSGAGKSTLFDLLLGFITPHSGQITINGKTLNAYNLRTWREQLAWLPQGPALFNATVRSNICFGAREAAPAQVIQAARLAQADSFIRQMPQGYDTPVGENGMRLSGGQVQRIALARALLLDASILLLDETGAHLDLKTERAIYRQLAALSAGGKTVFSIAHRAPAAAAAEHVIVLDQGRIVEQGAPAQLLQQSGVFKRLMALNSGEV